MSKYTPGFLVFAVFIIMFFALPAPASAHCDTLDGPLVNAGRRALESENASYALAWVKPENEEEIRRALARALQKRKQARTEDEKRKADMEFFEILARVHREGEGARYEGLKPAGSAEPEIVLADRAIETRELGQVLGQIQDPHSREIVTHLFHELLAKAAYDVSDVAAGREFVEAYAVFVHAVEKAVKGESLSAHHLHGH